MFDKFKDMDDLRSAALSKSETYHTKSSTHREFDIYNQVKHLIDSMPVFTTFIADLLAQHKIDKKNQSVGTSIYAKVKAMNPMNIIDTLKYVKTQKKDSLYDLYLHFRPVSY